MITAATASNHGTSTNRRSGPTRGPLGMPPGGALGLAAMAARGRLRAETAPPPPLERLAFGLLEAMRQELLECGGVLVLLNEQKSNWAAPDEGSLEQTRMALEDQFQALQTARTRRAERERRVREELQAPAALPFSQVLAGLPAQYQAVLATMAHEIAQLAERIRAELRQDHLLLSQCLARSQELLGWFSVLSQGPPAERRGEAQRRGERR
jgi:hypothetical protein